ncbi:hypothetical protein MTP09_02550 [Chryseobacterium suipulveris]|uniref:Uncharacterized protein n=1 Tax=Chryseobacterium suipulveris TaxID=2929800 RepID=A0ABY4BQQ8_9FLAO|nr:hypothetical protein [Chryseobacterium suipulveris]UOE41540.1 hypothetical protein MTP09_02550 [Chryseobacterium suipulveris]
MSKDLFFRISGLFAFVLLFMSVDVFGQIYTYDFGTGTGTADGSNANNGGAGITNFFTGTPAGGGTYRVRMGTAGGSLILANPGTSLGTGSEAQLTASSSGAVNMFSVYNWNNPQQILYLKTKIRSTSSADGTITKHSREWTMVDLK